MSYIIILYVTIVTYYNNQEFIIVLVELWKYGVPLLIIAFERIPEEHFRLMFDI